MANFAFDAGFRRRDVLYLASATGVAFLAGPQAYGANFWEKQKPADWTDKDKEELLTKSPWAKKVDADMSGAGGGRGGDSASVVAGADSAGGGRGGGGGGGRGGGRGGGGGAAVGSQITTLQIVWQSAKPVLDAHPLAFPAKLNNHYVIAVSGIPVPVLNAAITGRGGRGARGEGENPEPPPPSTPRDPTAGLKRGATLNVKGKEAQNADEVMSTGQDRIVFFAFPKDALPLTPADKEVEFILKLGGMTAKTKFDLKDMMYNGELAL